MTRQDEIVKERLRKIAELRKKGINPYPYKFDKKNDAAELQSKYRKLKKAEKTKTKVSVAGRVMVVRDIGKIIFTSLQDSSGKIQVVLQDKESPSKEINFFKKYIDAGDFIGVEGVMYKTKRGELSVLAKKIKLLSKSILPLPEKWHGLQDKEERYRKRYLDLVINPETKKIFLKKALFWQSIREFLLKESFVEVETPVLEATVGGADAQPFVTHYNAFDTDVYLRISMGELWQKRLMIGGFERIFEIGRQFRNEGISPEHLQDYTQMEFYWAYADYEDAMNLVEKMYKYVAKKVLGTLKFESKGFKIDIGKKFKKIDYVSEIKRQMKINVLKASKKEIEKKLDKLKISYDPNLEKPRLVDNLWKECRKKICGPAFLINHPVDISPLAKRCRKNNLLTERFNIIIAGSEIGNGYSELNDPIDQEERFKQQAKMREKGDKEAQMHDKDFVKALKYAMPPTAGFGVSERFFAFLVDKPVRECVLFPFMKFQD